MREIVTYAQSYTSGAYLGGASRIFLTLVQHHKDCLILEFWDCQLRTNPTDSKIPSDRTIAIQHWLWPIDESVRATYASLNTIGSPRAEFTCEWFSKPLFDFTRSSEKVFWIQGGAGYGKSSLYGWILDTLNNQVEGQDYAVLGHMVNPLLPSETTTTSLLKGLLRQAFEQNPGFAVLQDALVSVMNTPVTLDYPCQILNAL